MNPPKRKHTLIMDKFVCKISKNDDDRSTDGQMSTPTLTSLDTKCEVAPSKLQVTHKILS